MLVMGLGDVLALNGVTADYASEFLLIGLVGVVCFFASVAFVSGSDQRWVWLNG